MSLSKELLPLLKKRYAGFTMLKPGERVLLGIASLAMDFKVTEATGKNDGEYVEEIQRVAGYSKGANWCACTLYSLCIWLGVKSHPTTNVGRALAWKNPALRIKNPERGCYAIHDNGDGTGHIEIISAVSGDNLDAYGGNVSNKVRPIKRNISYYNGGFYRFKD